MQLLGTYEKFYPLASYIYIDAIIFDILPSIKGWEYANKTGFKLSEPRKQALRFR